jgi:hypothetical protein
MADELVVVAFGCLAAVVVCMGSDREWRFAALARSYL